MVCSYKLRGTNDIYKLSNGEKNYYVRLNRNHMRSEAEISNELEILTTIGIQSGCVALPVTANDHSKYQSASTPEGIRQLVVFEEAIGVTDNKPQPHRLAQAGRTLGKVHNFSSSLPQYNELPRYDIATCITQSTNIVCDFLHKDPELRRHSLFYQKFSLALKRELEHLPTDRFSYGLIHGDYLFGNFVYDKQGKATVYDFDRIGYGWHAFDIATYLGHLTSHSNVASPSTLFNTLTEHFLSGYQEEFTISESEREALPVIYLMRRLHMRALCCLQFIDWSNQFLNKHNWHRDIRKTKIWAAQMCGLSL
ncbi:phosphotransferase enzyme family protein [Pelagicoccus mobilis]|uniref:Phosphotransferase n=1 Tax=Pelagicoccus mobilis TaxID=415221 RepID=A0A934S1H6_9BACT|nr:phosphotransferase [Pelagicoccus mobilis]MBK1880631.1 phosphotransferase [Pelagicoccus mobilis]